MNEELSAKLAKDLRQSGFYSEMMAVRACVAKKWECHGGVTYFDKEERATRECDFEAVRRVTTLRGEHRSAQVDARLLGQVKKSERPWIVFKDLDLRSDYDGWSNMVRGRNITVGDPRIARALRAHSLLTLNRWRASGVHEAFKRPSDHSAWYSAFVTACKAAESAFDDFDERSRPARNTSLELIKPVVVLDGTLVVAELDDRGDLIFTEIETVGFRFEYRSELYHRPQYYVDLVTLKGFPAYLDLTTKRMKRVLHTLDGGRRPR